MKLAALAATVFLVAPATQAQNPYVYWGIWDNVRQASVAITSAHTTGSQHVSVWINASDTKGSWIQAGIYVGNGVPLCAYVEVHNGPAGTNNLRCIRSVTLGQRVQVRLSFSYRHGWVAWIDGTPEAQTALGGGVKAWASAEMYQGGTLTYKLKPLAT